jgi:hypothetical protein
VGSAALSIVFYLAFKVCERLLVERLTARKFGRNGEASAGAADDSVKRSA